MGRIPVSKINGTFYFNCPHCSGAIMTPENETRCCIFRHGAMKKNGEQINPHASQIECDRLYENGLINGCGKPFRFVYSSDQNYVEECDYL